MHIRQLDLFEENAVTGGLQLYWAKTFSASFRLRNDPRFNRTNLYDAQTSFKWKDTNASF